MAYRLQKDESVAKGMKRVVKKELRYAIDQLACDQPSDEAIHGARTSIKKVRAVLQLVGQDIDAGGALKRLRHAGHLLSPLRDADAVIVSAQALCSSERKGLTAKTCTALRNMLRREKARLTVAARRDHVKEQAAHALKRVQRSAKDWNWKNVGSSTLVAEIRRSYKKARRGMRRARDRGRPDAFHAWRKRVKTLWYALRLLERRVPLRRQVTDLERLETWLGDDHNLLVLGTQVGRSGRLNREQGGNAQVKGLAERRQQQLRRMALTVGVRVFKETSKAFAGRLRQMWRKGGANVPFAPTRAAFQGA